MKEQILVVPRKIFSGFLDFQGYRPKGMIEPQAWQAHFVFKDRESMETDPSFKQLIPYIVLRHEDQVYRYWRTKKAGESRLHHLYSIGIGGHINPRDHNLFTGTADLLREAAMRELREEVQIADPVEIKHLGYINDDQSEVGQVHLGIVYEAWLTNPAIRTNEAALSRGEWKPRSTLQDGSPYETWSQFLIEKLVNNT